MGNGDWRVGSSKIRVIRAIRSSKKGGEVEGVICAIPACRQAGVLICGFKKGATRPQRQQDKLAWLAWRAGRPLV